MEVASTSVCCVKVASGMKASTRMGVAAPGARVFAGVPKRARTRTDIALNCIAVVGLGKAARTGIGAAAGVRVLTGVVNAAWTTEGVTGFVSVCVGVVKVALARMGAALKIRGASAATRAFGRSGARYGGGW